MKSLEWALAFFFGCIGICLLSINILIMFWAYGIMSKLDNPPPSCDHYDVREARTIDQIDFTKGEYV